MITVQHGLMNLKHLSKWIKKENNYHLRAYKFRLLILDLYTSSELQELVINPKTAVEHISDLLMQTTYMILS